MKWTVLSDNRTCNDLLQTEHGLSILLETDKHRILLDTGASDVFIRNAKRLDIDLSTGDKVYAILKAVMGNYLHAFSCGMTLWPVLRRLP